MHWTKEDDFKMEKDDSNRSSYGSNDSKHGEETECRLEKKTSEAACLTHAMMIGQPERRYSRLSLTAEDSFTEELHDVQVEDIITTKSKKRKGITQKNTRAAMGYWKLIWSDLKSWYKRWKIKRGESLIFRKKIKTIESNFGSAVGSLFIFTRSLMYLNFFLSVLWLAAVVIPTACMFPYEDLKVPFAFKNLMDGKGVLALSWVFYGAYQERLGNYPLGLAYLGLLLITYFGSLFMILGRVIVRSDAKQQTTVLTRYPFSLMLWTSWDHSITSQEAAVNLAKGITSAFQDNLHDVKASMEVKERSREEKIKIYCLRILAWFITLILIGGGCTLIVYLVMFVSFKTDTNTNTTDKTGDTETGSFFDVYGTVIILFLLNACVPFCIKQLPQFERYTSGRDVLKITLIRIFFLRMANLFSLIISLYNTVTKLTRTCTGTVIGQEMYKLVIIDTILYTFITMSWSFGKYFWTRKKEEMDISAAVLVLVYRQALIWIGTLACPLLPLIGFFSNLMFFYSTHWIVLHTCKPPIKRWNQSRNNSLFSAFLLTSMLLVIPPASVIIGSEDVVNLGQTDVSGQFCGPFGQDKPTRMYSQFSEDQPYWVRTVMYWLTSETVLLPIFFILVSYAIHQWRIIGKQKSNAVILRTELMHEREENEKLIKKLQSTGLSTE